MYRALALATQRAGIADSDTEALAAWADANPIDMAEGRVCVGGQDVTDAIRTPEIGERASRISAHPSVRQALVKRQQALTANGGVVVEGRDATTVIAPGADVRVYLTASLEERARRREAEFRAKGEPAEYERVRAEMAVRDHRDITREDSPLTVAPGVAVIESAGIPVEEVVLRIRALLPADVA